MTSGPILFVSDVEGQWQRLAGFVAAATGVRLQGDTLLLDDGVTFVFGGDAIDRGPWGRRVVRTLLEAKRRYGDRVVLLAGNRDLNKLRLWRELQGHPPVSTPAEVRGDRPALLKYIFARTMGADGAFAFRAQELAAEGAASDDHAVVDSFLADVAPDGTLVQYLSACILAYRAGPNLFVHGAVTAENICRLPDGTECRDVDGWVDGLNHFCRTQVKAFQEQYREADGRPGWAPIITYQAPRPGLGSNPHSVVYGRSADAASNPGLPGLAVIDRLRADGVRRLVVGHTPHGDTPVLLRGASFELLVADNSRGRVAEASLVRIVDSRLEVAAQAVLDDGERVAVSFTSHLAEDPGFMGRRSVQPQALVKGRMDDGRWLLGWNDPRFQLRQQALMTLDPDRLETPWLQD